MQGIKVRSEVRSEIAQVKCDSSTSTLRTGLTRLYVSDTDRYPIGGFEFAMGLRPTHRDESAFLRLIDFQTGYPRLSTECNEDLSPTEFTTS